MTETAKTLTEILRVISWPLCAIILGIVFLFLFKNSINGIIPRLSKSDIQVSNKGFRLTFEQSLQSQVTQLDDLQSDIKLVVDTSAISQDRAVTLVWNLLEKKLKRIMAVSHWNEGIFVDNKTNIAILVDLGVLATNTLPNLKAVENERDRVAQHRKEGEKAATEAAIITGIQILRSLYSISLQDNIVEIPNIILYSDKDCKNIASNVTGVMIKQIMIDGLAPVTNVFPTTRTDYKAGEHLTWDWNMSNIWNALWYKDPKSGEIKAIHAAEFVGGDIDDL